MPTVPATRPAAAVFDNDGLLLDTEEAWTRAEVRLFAGYGAAFTMAHKRDLIGSSHHIAGGKLAVMLEQPKVALALLRGLAVRLRELTEADHH